MTEVGGWLDRHPVEQGLGVGQRDLLHIIFPLHTMDDLADGGIESIDPFLDLPDLTGVEEVVGVGKDLRPRQSQPHQEDRHHRGEAPLGQ